MNHSAKKRILVVAESIDVEDSSGSKANVALIKNLNDLGFGLIVYHYTKKEISLEGIKCIAIKEKRRSFLFFLSRFERQLRLKLGIDFHRPLQKVFGFSFTLFNDRNSIISALKKTCYDPDLVITLSKGGSFRPHHALLKLPKFHDKWLAYMHDPYPMHQYPKPYTWYEPGYMIKENFVKDISRKAKFSAFPSKILKEWMGSFNPQFLNSGIIIPHQISEEEDKDTESIIPNFFTIEEFNVLHAGNLLDARNPEGLINAFNKFLNKVPAARNESKLIFLGNNNNFAQKFITSNKNIYISNSYIEFKIVLNLQKMAAVNVILEAKGEMSPFLPGKFPHCIKAGKPILLLGPPISETRRLLGDKYSYWSEIDDEDAIINHLIKLYWNWKMELPQDHNYEKLQKYLSKIYLRQIMDKILNGKNKSDY